MIEIIQQVHKILVQCWQNIEIFLEPLFHNLDPSLFQNVIIGILMVLIFVGEQIFAEIKTQEKRGEFSKMVIFYEVFNVTKIAVLAILSIFLISFFKNYIDNQYVYSIGLTLKLIVTIIVFIIAFILIKPVFKFQTFLMGKRYKFEISFLKNLNFSTVFRFKNQLKAEKVVRAWNSFWSEKSEFNENNFTDIFISHVDNAIKFKKRSPFELMFFSLMVSSLSCIVLTLLLVLLKISVNVILPVVAPVWISGTTLIFTAWKDN